MLRQKSHQDSLIVLNDPIPFEDKLRQSFQTALNNSNPYAIIIDADIIVCYTFINKVKKLIKSLPPEDLGFGLKVLDRFYGYPKYRGIHIYNVRLLDQAIQYIPPNGKEMRPESFVKEKMLLNGHRWNNNLSKETYGIHDYFQNYEDVFCKISIRSHRSRNDINYLQKRFSKYQNIDYRIASKALGYGLTLDKSTIENNRDIFRDAFYTIFPFLNQPVSLIPFYVRIAPELFVSYQIMINKYRSLF